MNRHVPMRRCMGGFSLLEVLVAFTILALTLGVLWQIFSATAQRATVVQETHRAVMLAESKMSDLALPDLVRAGTDAGEVDATFHWQRRVEPLDAKRAIPGTRQWAAYRVIVQVQWSPREARVYGQDGPLRSVVLTTVRMGVAE
jgi:general secretion pathway protein I